MTRDCVYFMVGCFSKSLANSPTGSSTAFKVDLGARRLAILFTGSRKLSGKSFFCSHFFALELRACGKLTTDGASFDSTTDSDGSSCVIFLKL